MTTYRASVAVSGFGTVTNRWHKVLALESAADAGVDTYKKESYYLVQ